MNATRVTRMITLAAMGTTIALGGCAMPEWSLHPKGMSPNLTTPLTNRGGEVCWAARDAVRPWGREGSAGAYAARWRGRLAQSTPYHVPPIEQVQESLQVWDGWGCAGAPDF